MIRYAAIVALLALVMPVAPVMAADFIDYSTSTSEQVPVAPGKASDYDWNGFYAGVMGGVQASDRGNKSLSAGLDLGVQTTVNFVLAGAEVAVVGLGDANGASSVQGIGRAGVLLTDTALLYGAAGYGAPLGGGAGTALVGGGVELGLTNDVSVRAQYLRALPADGADGTHQVTLGAQFHF